MSLLGKCTYCPRSVRSSGTDLCSKHWDRRRNTGSPLGVTRCPPGESLDTKLRWHGWTVVQRDTPYAEGPCWEWGGRRNKQGYGQLKHESRYEGAHRWAYRAGNGDIPPGALVRHKCDNPPCINPDHLELGTKLDNARDSVMRGTCPNRGSWARKGERAPQSKLTDAERVELIELRQREGLSYSSLGKMFGLSLQGAWSVVNRWGVREGFVLPKSKILDTAEEVLS